MVEFESLLEAVLDAVFVFAGFAVFAGALLFDVAAPPQPIIPKAVMVITKISGFFI